VRCRAHVPAWPNAGETKSNSSNKDFKAMVIIVGVALCGHPSSN